MLYVFYRRSWFYIKGNIWSIVPGSKAGFWGKKNELDVSNLVDDENALPLKLEVIKYTDKIRSIKENY